jgi:hypothetical protein
MKSEHYFQANQAGVFGVSRWSIPQGRLRREMIRSTRLGTIKAIRAWGKRHAISETDIQQAIGDGALHGYICTANR